MRRELLYLVVVFVLIGVMAHVSKATTIPYPNVGTPNPITYTFTATSSADVVGYFTGSGASYVEEVGVLDNGALTSVGLGLQNHTSSIGQSFDFGPVKAGDSLVFVLVISSPVVALIYSDPSLNGSYDTDGSDGHNHVYSVSYAAGTGLSSSIPSGTYVGFEDLAFPVSDFNYYDATYVFTNVSTNVGATPEPLSAVLLGFGLLGVGLVRVRRSSGKL